ncbi:MAG: phosphohydrolase [Actinobacteria bacterium HGW-Actinobacteria-7]|jgi:DNA-directed RNA polymerase subunit RPC12/RpoP|nr:MAG: phosphohydrolase [Actinobacteria bacterium HGW-Actinobacteria-7]
MAESPSICPGRDGRNLTAQEIACPECGYSVEFFSDEKARRCPGCGFRVSRATSGGCDQWCGSADQCSLARKSAPDDAAGGE